MKLWRLLKLCGWVLVWMSLVVGCRPSATQTSTRSATQYPRGLTATPSLLETPGLFVAQPPASLPLSGGIQGLPASESQAIPGEWRFTIDKKEEGEKESWFAQDYDDSSWQTVEVPHTWNVMPKYANFSGLAWYRRKFELPETARGMHLSLRFQAVFYLARVWLNGTYLGAHEGGYTPFEFDVSAIAKPGVENLLAVQVDNLRDTDRIPANLSSGWSFDWWNYGGIVRPVSLEMTGGVYISRLQIVAVPHLIGPDEADTANVTATLTLSNTTSSTFNGQVSLAIQAEGGTQTEVASEPVYSSSAAVPVALRAGESAQVSLTALLEKPRLWHFDHPELYVSSASLQNQDGQDVHHISTIFGIRQVQLKDGRFYLNGEAVRLVGLTRHADSPQHGLAETVDIMAADYDDLKALNEVFTRPVHYPQAEFILDYADRHGILLIPEVPAWQLSGPQMSMPKLRDLEKQQLREMILASFNHPSVWAWSVGNEIESDTPSGHAFVKEMVAYVKSLDPTRPVGFASNHLGTNPQQDATQYSDFVLMNQYFGTWAAPKGGLSAALDAIHQAWPDKSVIISEFGFEGSWNRPWGPPSSTLDPGQYYFIPENVSSGAPEADVQRQQVIREQMEIFRGKPFIAGAIFWTYQDYRTPAKFMMGIVDADRNRRGSYQIIREQFSPLIVDLFKLTPSSAAEVTAQATLRARGPVEVDLPAYTLRGYRLRWVVKSQDGSQVYAQGEIELPVLAPGATWSGEFSWSVAAENYLIALTAIRPTGSSVFDYIYEPTGELVK